MNCVNRNEDCENATICPCLNYDEIKFTLNNLEVIDIHPTEVIIFFFSIDELSPEDINYYVAKLKEKFPNNTVIALPNNTSLESLSEDVLENWISMISKIKGRII